MRKVKKKERKIVAEEGVRLLQVEGMGGPNHCQRATPHRLYPRECGFPGGKKSFIPFL